MLYFKCIYMLSLRLVNKCIHWIILLRSRRHLPVDIPLVILTVLRDWKWTGPSWLSLSHHPSFVQISKTRACGEQGRADRTHPSLAPPRHHQTQPATTSQQAEQWDQWAVLPPSLPPPSSLPPPCCPTSQPKNELCLTGRLQPQPTLTQKMSGSKANVQRCGNCYENDINGLYQVMDNVFLKPVNYDYFCLYS